MRFLLFHRRRVWNESEQKWIGWERKRGKLHELNRLLRGANDTTFMPTAGRAPLVPSDVRYVITLDADTRLPRGAACRLVGTMAHPLNRPRFDPRVGRVVEGYAVLQPRVTPTLPTDREGSLFQRIFSGLAGMDPYASATSDVYQDLLGEGSYTGKGIYDVDAFEAALAGRVPENALLSHDLFEGTFARAGLVTDIEVFEEFPSHYEVAAARQHRWARGDWQLLPWIMGHARARAALGVARRIPLIGRWKMLDNLRRTLSAPAALLTLLIGWTLPFAAPLICTTFRACDHRLSGSAALPDRSHSASPRDCETQPRACGRLRTWSRRVARFAGGDVAGASGMVDDRRDRSDALSCVCDPPQSARVGDCGAGQSRVRPYPRSRVSPHGRGCGARRSPQVSSWQSGSQHAWPVAVPFVLLWVLSPLVARWISLPPRAAGARATRGR